jgi:hypothetical protein
MSVPANSPGFIEPYISWCDACPIRIGVSAKLDTNWAKTKQMIPINKAIRGDIKPAALGVSYDQKHSEQAEQS